MLYFIVSEVSQGLINVMHLFCVLLCKKKYKNGAALSVHCFQQFNCIVLCDLGW